MDFPATRQLAFAIGILRIIATTRFSFFPYGVSAFHAAATPQPYPETTTESNTMPTIDHFMSWIERDLCRFGTTEHHVQEVAGNAEPGETSKTVRFYTTDNVYSVRAVERDGNAGYLGCGAASRAPNPGEDHLRGSDLADGNLSEATWHRILGDIVSYELQPLYIRPATPLPGIAAT